jgi:hypothetical protein
MEKKSGLLNRFRPLAASATKEGIQYFSMAYRYSSS